MIIVSNPSFGLPSLTYSAYRTEGSSVLLKHISRYEFTLIVSFGFMIPNVAKMTLQTFYHANIGYLINWKIFMLAYGFMAMFFCIGDACYNYLWVNILGFFPPKPFGGFTGLTCRS